MSLRRKCRLRWYGDFQDSDNFQFEVKYKNDLLGGKHTFSKISEINIQETKSLYPQLRSKLPFEFQLYLDQYSSPTVFNRYEREYYTNKNNIRLTIDKNLLHTNLNSVNFPKKRLEKSEIYAVLEIKYDNNTNKESLEVLSTLPFGITKNSKYVNAVNLL